MNCVTQLDGSAGIVEGSMSIVEGGKPMKTKDRMYSVSRSTTSRPSRNPCIFDAVRERIAKKAYELYEQRGRQVDRDVEDWLKAKEGDECPPPGCLAPGLTHGRESTNSPLYTVGSFLAANLYVSKPMRCECIGRSSPQPS